MAIINKLTKYMNFISVISPIVATLFIGIWFIYSYDKRISMIESNTSTISNMQEKLSSDDRRISLLENQCKDISNDITSINADQNREIQQIREDLNNGFARVEDKIERLYIYRAENKHDFKNV